MSENLLSLGLDVGTTTTQLILSNLRIENKGSAFSVPELQIANREILYRSPVVFTPLLGNDRVDGEKIRQFVAREYEKAGIARHQVDTGAIIVTGESSRKENAREVLAALSEFAGDFVVATAGPHLESVLAAKGAGADRFSEETGRTVLHIDIGGGTANMALIKKGNIVATGCMNVGGRLLKLEENGRILYRSPVLEGLFPLKTGEIATSGQLKSLCDTLAQALEMAVGLTPPTSLPEKLWTAEAGAIWEIPKEKCVISFSGGVALCMQENPADFSFGDIGVMLGQAILKSKLCQGQYRLSDEAIRATVIGAGCYSTRLSGSTVFHRGISFPLKNLPVICLPEEMQSSSDLPRLLSRVLSRQETLCAVALPDVTAVDYGQVSALAAKLSAVSFPDAVVLVLQADMAKALGHALALRLPPDKPILCIDRVHLPSESYLDVGAPVGSALPIVIKTLIMEK